jgi:transglutaminase-like putative cysteine protease
MSGSTGFLPGRIICSTYRALAFLPLFLVTQSLAQDHGFPFGKALFRDLEMTSYPNDTAAAAVVLQEFGEAYVDSDEMNLRFEYHVKIKILKPSGLKYGDVELYLHRQEGKEETVNWFHASSFNLENGKIVESKMEQKPMRQELSTYTVVQSFPIPNVKVGSVVEYSYHLESPWLNKFHPWEFQSDIPKVSSEYWATIPAYYRYNVTLRGFLKLTKNESEVIRNAFNVAGLGSADCARMMYAMTDIPAFVEEEYVTARSNYLAAINFELLEVRYPDGRVEKITTEWKDAMNKLWNDPQFGGQVRRGKNILENDVAPVVAGADDPLERARKIYDFVKFQYEWNGTYGKYSESGIRKALDSKKGNIGDINLTLIAALRAADLPANPVILSTRANGFPIEIHPVITDFNYVIASLQIGEKRFLLDATDDFMPFGLIPERCINSKGRLMEDRESQWVSLDVPGNKKWVGIMNLKVLGDGRISGSVSLNYYSYSAVDERRRLYGAENPRPRLSARPGGGMESAVLSNIVLENLDALEKPLTVKFDIESEVFDPAGSPSWLLNPFFVSSWKENPFKAAERMYPVEFGIPIDERMIVTIEFPEGHEVKSIPENVGLSLPNNGGRYIFQAKAEGNKVNLSSNFIITKNYYSSEEYHYLKELFARMIQTQATDLVIERH